MKHLKTFEQHNQFATDELLNEEFFGKSDEKKFKRSLEEINKGTYIYNGNVHDDNAIQGGKPAEAKLKRGAKKYTGNIQLDPKFKSDEELLKTAKEDNFNGFLKVLKSGGKIIYTYTSKVAAGSGTAQGTGGGTAG